MPRWLRTHSLQGPFLVLHDAVALYVAIGLVHQVRLGHWVTVDASLVLVIAFMLIGLYIGNVYHLARQQSPARLALRTFFSAAFTGAVIAAFIYVAKATDVATVLWRGNLPVSLFFFAVWAGFVRYVLSMWTRHSARPATWLVIGNKTLAQRLVDDYEQTVLPGNFKIIDESIAPLGLINIEAMNPNGVFVAVDEATIFDGMVTGIVLAPMSEVPEKLTSQLMRIRLKGLPVLQFSDFYEQHLLRVPVQQIKEHWFAFAEGFSLLHRDVELKLKRLLDVSVAAFMLVVTIPLLLLVWCLIVTTSTGPALYSQTRCGFKGRHFKLRKFRSMVHNAENDGARWAQPGDPRVTKVGSFLRKTRFDELPQLWNVLTGDMSFIGPRPERPDFVSELEKEIPYYEFRHLIKPGITGWAQVMYPYGSSIEDARNKLEFDLYYIKNYSFALDLYILLRTIRVVLSRTGR